MNDLTGDDGEAGEDAPPEPDSYKDERTLSRQIARNAKIINDSSKWIKLSVGPPGRQKAKFYESDSKEDLANKANSDRRKIKNDDKRQDVQLKRLIAISAIVFVSAQILFSNVFFGFYLALNVNDLDPRIMLAWLSASVVEIIGILGVVAKSLFPSKARRRK